MGAAGAPGAIVTGAGQQSLQGGSMPRPAPPCQAQIDRAPYHLPAVLYRRSGAVPPAEIGEMIRRVSGCTIWRRDPLPSPHRGRVPLCNDPPHAWESFNYLT